ncbi:MAG: membrane protein insertion efficiency factor YidD [Verrucomicrobia bacterium]|nr:membrane protein insertion efficiency factor YidD [Verrucomicrobiota bacterium]
MKRVVMIGAILGIALLADMIAARTAITGIDYYKENISESYCFARHITCSFPEETCSQYAKHSIQRFGFFIGGCEAYKRLFDCAWAGLVPVAKREDLLCRQ